MTINYLESTSLIIVCVIVVLWLINRKRMDKYALLSIVVTGIAVILRAMKGKRK